MKKQILGMVIALAGVTPPIYAQSSVTLYGLIDTGISYLSNAQTGSVGGRLVGHPQYAMTDGGTGGRGGSRWGFKGSEDLGGGWAAIFTLENGFNLPSGTFAQGGALFGRQAFAGLRGPYGTLTLGRQYAPTFDVMHDFSPTHVVGIGGALPGDIDGSEGTRRINNAVKFANAFGPVYLSGLYAFGGKAGDFTTGQTISAAGSYRIGGLAFGVAYFNARNPNLSAFGNNPNSGTAASNNIGSAGSESSAQSNPVYAGYASANTLEIENAGVSYVAGPWWLGIEYSHATFGALGNLQSGPNLFRYQGNAAFNSVAVSASYNVTPALNLGGVYSYTRAAGVAGHDGANYHQAIVEAQYALSKRTELYAQSVYQIASGTNSLDQPAVASIELLTPSATNHQLLMRVGIVTTF